MISIILPMRNEEQFVSRCLDSVLAQLEHIPDCEVFCVDGASTDRTREIVEHYSRRDRRIHLIDNPRKIVPAAMNKAIAMAKGDFIIRLDCHAEYDHAYVRSCLEVIQRTGADNVGGYGTTLPSRNTKTGRAIAAATSSRFGVGGSVFRIGGGEQEVDTVPFGCFRRDVFDRFGLYNEKLVRNQDLELNCRILSGGGKILISPTIKLTYYNQATYRGLGWQSFRNGMWNMYAFFIVGGGLRLRHLVPFCFVSSLLLLFFMGFFFRFFWGLVSAELLLYVLSSLVMALRAAREPGNWPRILFAFFVLHGSYGLGSLWGLASAPFKFGFSGLRKSWQNCCGAPKKEP